MAIAMYWYLVQRDLNVTELCYVYLPTIASQCGVQPTAVPQSDKYTDANNVSMKAISADLNDGWYVLGRVEWKTRS